MFLDTNIAIDWIERFHPRALAAKAYESLST